MNRRVARLVNVCIGAASLLPMHAMAWAFADLPPLRYPAGILLCAAPAVIDIVPPLSGFASAEIVLTGRAKTICDFVAAVRGDTGGAQSVAQAVRTAPIVRNADPVPAAASPSPNPRAFAADDGWQHRAAVNETAATETRSGRMAAPAAAVPRLPRREFAAIFGAMERAATFDPAWLFGAAALAACFVVLVFGLLWLKDVVFSERAVLARAAARGLRRNEFSVDYQPIVHLQTRKCIGLKVGVRWKNTRHGLQGAGHFMEKLRGSDVASRIHAYVISRAWRDTDNVPSFASLYIMVDGWTACVGDHAKARRIADLAKKFVHTRFVLQVPADALAQTTDVLLALRKLGVRVGLSGFAAHAVPRQTLLDLRPAYLKVHRSVMAMPKDERYRTLRDTARLGRELEIATIANGVESSMQFEAAAAANVDFAQGFFLGRAMLIDQLTAFIETSRSVSVA